MTTEYVERELIKVTDPKKALNDRVTSFWAVTDDTYDNMINVDYSRMNDPDLQQITMEYLGTVKVEVPNDT